MTLRLVRAARTSEETGALSPAFLFLLLAVIGSLLLFMQFGHGIVLAREASTAADAAALGAADTHREAWGRYVQWYRQCALAEVTGEGSCGEDPLPTIGHCTGPARTEAERYAGANGANLTSCQVIGVSFGSGIRVAAAVRGDSGTIDGPSATMPQQRPNADAVAAVPAPPGISSVLSVIDDWVADIADVIADDDCDPDADLDPDDEDAEPCEPASLPGPPAGLDDQIQGIFDATIVRLVQ
jgi:hypothetical protein